MEDSNELITPYQIVNAICSNSIAELNEFIDLGGDVNMECRFPKLISGIAEKFAPYFGLSCIVFSLHQAVRACYDRACHKSLKTEAVAVLERLLKAGADPNIKIEECYVCKVDGAACLLQVFPGGTALALSDYLLQHNIDSVAHQNMMHKVKQLLRGKMIKCN